MCPSFRLSVFASFRPHLFSLPIFLKGEYRPSKKKKMKPTPAISLPPKSRRRIPAKQKKKYEADPGHTGHFKIGGGGGGVGFTKIGKYFFCWLRGVYTGCTCQFYNFRLYEERARLFKIFFRRPYNAGFMFFLIVGGSGGGVGFTKNENIIFLMAQRLIN